MDFGNYVIPTVEVGMLNIGFLALPSGRPYGGIMSNSHIIPHPIKCYKYLMFDITSVF